MFNYKLIILINIIQFLSNVELFQGLNSCPNYLPNERTNFLFLVGVEGSGHHALRNILGLEEKESFYFYSDNIREAAFKIYKENIFIPEFLENKRKFSTIISKEKENHDNFFEDISFPSSNPRNSLRRLDILDLIKELSCSFSSVRLLFLYRSLPSVLYSTFHKRAFSLYLIQQLNIIKDNYDYLSSVLNSTKSLGNNRIKIGVIMFEDLFYDSNQVVSILSNFTLIPDRIIRNGLEKFHLSEFGKEMISEEGREKLESREYRIISNLEDLSIVPTYSPYTELIFRELSIIK